MKTRRTMLALKSFCQQYYSVKRANKKYLKKERQRPKAYHPWSIDLPSSASSSSNIHFAIRIHLFIGREHGNRAGRPFSRGGCPWPLRLGRVRLDDESAVQGFPNDAATVLAPLGRSSFICNTLRPRRLLHQKTKVCKKIALFFWKGGRSRWGRWRRGIER